VNPQKAIRSFAARADPLHVGYDGAGGSNLGFNSSPAATLEKFYFAPWRLGAGKNKIIFARNRDIPV
jgi:hypothetical protein